MSVIQRRLQVRIRILIRTYNGSRKRVISTSVICNNDLTTNKERVVRFQRVYSKSVEVIITLRSVIRRFTNCKSFHLQDFTRKGPSNIARTIYRRNTSTRNQFSTSIFSISNFHCARVRQRSRAFLLRSNYRRTCYLCRSRYVKYLSKGSRVHRVLLCTSTRGLRAEFRRTFQYVTVTQRSTIKW